MPFGLSDMSNLISFPALIAVLPPALLLLGLLVTACLILVGYEWRVEVLALLLQYGLVGILLTKDDALPAAGAIIITGVVVVWILYLSAHGAPLPAQSGRERLFRLLATAVLAVGVYGIATHLQDPPLGASPQVLMAAGWLVAMGLLIVALAHDPLRLGLGLCTFQTGIEVAYLAVERSLAVMGLLAAVNWAIALGVGTLLLATQPSQERGEGWER
jgi:hypothetical protein